MNQVPLFLSRFYPLEVVVPRIKFIQGLVRYIRDGVTSQYGPSEILPGFSTFSQAVDAHLLQFVMDNTYISSRVKTNTGIQMDIVVEAYRNAMALNSVNAICTPSFSLDRECDAFQKAMSTVDYVYEEAKPSVLGAYKMTRQNMAQADTQLVTLTVIHELCKHNHNSEVRLPAVSEIRAELIERSRQFMVQAMVLGGLLGGKHAKDVLALATRETMHNPDANINFAVIQLLQPAGRLPGQWESAPEEKLRADIKRYYDELTGTKAVG